MMITNFKLFEKHGDADPMGEFEQGDYILIDITEIRTMPKECVGTWDYYFDNIEYPHSVTLFIGDDTETTGVSRSEIKRKLTPEEIDDFETKKQANRYNL